MDEVRVESWGELQEVLYEESWKETLRRFRSDFAFRGHSRASDDLSTSLVRLGGDYAALENHLLRNFRKYARRDAVAVDSPWDWLALAKHHELPTRVVDWTYSPYVALHFVTSTLASFDDDGAVWCLDYVRASEHLPAELRAVLEEEGSNVFTAEMLAAAAPTLAEFDALGDEPFVAFFEPPSVDERIVNQFALFSLMSDPRAHLDEWLASHPDLVRRVVVPAELKWEVRDKLDQANVTERVLFPGLDGLARWLTRHYGPRGE